MFDSIVANDLQAFHTFVAERLDSGCQDSPEQCILEFRQYQQELLRLKQRLQVSHAQHQAGQAKPLDVEQLLVRVNERIHADQVVE